MVSVSSLKLCCSSWVPVSGRPVVPSHQPKSQASFRTFLPCPPQPISPYAIPLSLLNVSNQPPLLPHRSPLIQPSAATQVSAPDSSLLAQAPSTFCSYGGDTHLSPASVSLLTFRPGCLAAAQTRPCEVQNCPHCLPPNLLFCPCQHLRDSPIVPLSPTGPSHKPHFRLSPSTHHLTSSPTVQFQAQLYTFPHPSRTCLVRRSRGQSRK